MTNVPDDIRQTWKDIYVLFDTHFKMDIHSQDDWNNYWNKANDIWEKSNKNCHILALLNETADLLVDYATGQ